MGRKMDNDIISIRFVKDEDFVNYRKPAMFIGTARCDFKCCTEGNFPKTVCQNHDWISSKIIEASIDFLIARYIENPFTNAIVFGGLEPFLQAQQIIDFVTRLRKLYHYNDTVVIYTGYTKEELQNGWAKYINDLKALGNIIIKYGRYVMNDEPHYDDVLGVNLASANQYAERIA